MERVIVIGAGLAGCEAAWQLAKRGVPVRLYEMRPNKQTAAHTGGGFAELVCSNSLRANNIENAVGLLKEEMRRLDSLIMRAADYAAVPAGGALAVDRARFSAYIEEQLTASPLIEVVREEVTELPDTLTVVAAGPLASQPLAEKIAALTEGQQLFFHDAIAPIVAADSINMDIAFFASRYGKGDGTDYLNCPMDKEQYTRFYTELINAELAPLHDFEKEHLFSGCMPIEAMAKLGEDTMRFGPLKPVGLELPGGGQAYAVVQLRKENIAADAYNLVGFQTRLRYPEQKRVFSLIPGLENAEFLRLGSMHRNTYINSPKVLLADGSGRLKAKPNLLFAGQISGVEGYVESAASGLVAGINAALLHQGAETVVFPRETALGALISHTTTPTADFQPMNVNFGLIPPPEMRIRGKAEKNAYLAKRALEALEAFKQAKPEVFAAE